MIGVPSMVWSMYLTLADPGRAFFVSTTRVWELAVGGGLAIVAPLVGRFPRVLAPPIAVLGLVGIVAATVLFDDSTLFPGYAALLPVGAAALVLSAGIVNPESRVTKWLGLKPLVAIGAMSYSLYLWHWPLLVAAEAQWGPLRLRERLAVVIFSVVPAYFSYALIEHRWRRSEAFVTPPSRGLRYGLALTAVGVAAGVALYVAVPESYAGLESIRPNPLQARADIPDVYENGCHQNELSSDVTTCTYGPDDSDFNVVLVGDSHAAQWIPALEPLALSNGWQLTTMTKSACQLADVAIAIVGTVRPNASCLEWNDNVVTQLIETKPDLVLVTGIFWPGLVGPDGILNEPDTEAELRQGLARTWSHLSQEGVNLVAIRDVPHPGFDVAECVAENPLSLDECAFGRADAMARNTPHVEAGKSLGLSAIDLTDEICGPTVCPAVEDNILVWRDDSHLTATYAKRLAVVLGARIQEITGHR